MSKAVALLLVLCATVPAGAQKRKRGQNFWQGVAHPHQAEVDQLLQRARTLRSRAQSSGQPQRQQAYDGAIGRFKKALELAPDQASVAAELAQTAKEAGEFAVAVDAFRHLAAVDAESRVYAYDYDLAFSLFRLRRWEEAREALDHGFATGRIVKTGYPMALRLYGYTNMNLGRLDDAIEAYTTVVDGQAAPQGYGGGDVAAPLTDLAVALDRDEQHALAADALDRAQQYDPNFDHLLTPYALVPFSPAADRHYWLGLAYERRGLLTEAAAEWRNYAQSADPPPLYKKRAEEHLRAVTAELDKRIGRKPAKPAGATAPRPSRPTIRHPRVSP